MKIYLSREQFSPDLSQPIIFPWEDVIFCFDKALDNVAFENHRPCPKCNRPANSLVWIEFKSPDITWAMLCGRKGPLSICQDCKIQVDFWMTMLS